MGFWMEVATWDFDVSYCQIVAYNRTPWLPSNVWRLEGQTRWVQKLISLPGSLRDVWKTIQQHWCHESTTACFCPCPWCVGNSISDKQLMIEKRFGQRCKQSFGTLNSWWMVISTGFCLCVCFFPDSEEMWLESLGVSYSNWRWPKSWWRSYQDTAFEPPFQDCRIEIEVDSDAATPDM